MTKSRQYLTLVAAVLGLASVAAVAQGPGNAGWQCPYGPGLGLGGYGWQGRINQVGDSALEAEIADIHQAIRRAQWDLRVLRSQGGDTSALEAEIAQLRDRLQTLNEQAGLCLGTGPNAYGLYRQPGIGGPYGVGMGIGYDYGRGYRYGYGAGPRGRWNRYSGPGYGSGPPYGVGGLPSPSGLSVAALNNLIRQNHQRLIAARDAGQDTRAIEAEIRRLSALRTQALRQAGYGG